MHHGERHVIVNYDFDEAQINRAAVNTDDALVTGRLPLPDKKADEADEEGHADTAILKEVMLFFEQASRKPGREAGRTGDKGIVPEVSPKALPVYFRKSIQDLKERMVRTEINPLSGHAFVVDVFVEKIDGKPKAYIVTDVHKIMELGED